MTKNLPKYYNNRSKEHNLSGGAQMLNVVTTTEGSADSQSRHLVSGKFRAAHQSNQNTHHHHPTGQMEAGSFELDISNTGS